MRTKIVVMVLSLVLMSCAVLAGPIHQAAMDGDLEQVKGLIEKDPALKDAHDSEDNQWTPLHCAVAFGKLDVVGYLLSQGADVNLKDDEGCTPLFKAGGAGEKAEKIAATLIDKGAKVDITNDLGKTPLHDAALVGNKALVKLLLDKGAKVDVKDKEGWTPLYEAAMY